LKIARDTWREEQEDDDNPTDKDGILKYIRDRLEEEFPNFKIPSARTIWEDWGVKNIAPADVRRPGKRPEKKPITN